MVDKISIVVADDHPLFREGVSNTLSVQPDFEVVATCTTADEAVATVCEVLPDIALLDISMPGGGVSAVERISALCPVVKILMLTVSEDQTDVVGSLEAGARGYILKGVGGNELIRIIRATHEGESYVSPELAARLLGALGNSGDRAATLDLFSELSVREEQILKGVARGLSNKEIALELKLSDKTIKHYMTNVLQKLQVRNRVEAALKARDRYLAK